MNQLHHSFRDDARSDAPQYSLDRHRRLLAGLERAVPRAPERPLPRVTGPRTIAGLGVVVLTAVAVVVGYRQPASPSAAFATHDFGAPMRVADRSISVVQVAANDLDVQGQPLMEPAGQAFRFFVDQMLMMKSLAVPAQPKAPA